MNWMAEKQITLPIAATPAASTAQSAVKKPRGRPPKARAVKKLRLGKFDKFLLDLVRRGEGDSEALRSRYNLDPVQFEARLGELAKAGYVTPDARDPKTLHLGLAGFNAFPPKLAPEQKAKEAATASSIKGEESAPQSKSVSMQSSYVSKPPADAYPLVATAAMMAPSQMRPGDSAQVAPVKAAAAAVQGPAQSASLEPDLTELLSRGKGSPNQYNKTFVTISAVGRKWLEEQGERKPVEETLIVEVPHPKSNKSDGQGKASPQSKQSEGKSQGADEHCELCRAPFLLSMGKDANPKYGHCFCGAPYHKDCYDSLLEGSGTRCVRCGKRLSLILDKVSEEAVKELKKLFD